MARFKVDVPLRWSDMDAFGHVNNNQFMVLLEEARVAMMFSAAAESGIPGFREGVVVARHEVDFLLPVTVPAETRVELWVERIGNSSFSFAYELTANDKLALRAKTVMVPFDIVSQRPRRITAEERAYLEQWTD
ncbi:MULTISPECIES: acyl-CoA thioesterase [Glycomyces]|uniref:Acyl-CoA thioester hydrolase n=2 Tax=Glycomyces TaxID=58113 RepID=A0A9X3PPG2_9ACTN|nr:thioesterase family protein [Glycomyces lechevalierae]MDA1386827.1 thioesterase family protein [Glycomyces lechevalierae]MDR7340182.1 acyl-CoA thioester hydrolase [Glycomyces lechevalierae]